MRIPDGHDVVVGVDGSQPGRQALAWAAREARRCGCRLRVLLAYRWQPGTRFLPDDDADEVAEAQAEGVVDEAVADALRAAPGIAASGAVVRAHPAAMLLDAAEKARLVVVGHRGRGGFASLALGSTSLRVATHAPCPVVVVRGRPGERDDTPGDPVVLGLNGSASATVGIGFAFDHAADQDCGVLVAHSYPATADGERIRAEVTHELTPFQDRYPQVPVDYAIVPGSAADLLTRLSRRARLVIVGHRGRGGFTGLLLGSVSQHLIHTAHCPVLIARPER